MEELKDLVNNGQQNTSNGTNSTGIKVSGKVVLGKDLNEYLNKDIEEYRGR